MYIQGIQVIPASNNLNICFFSNSRNLFETPINFPGDCTSDLVINELLASVQLKTKVKFPQFYSRNGLMHVAIVFNCALSYTLCGETMVTGVIRLFSCKQTLD